MKWSSLPSESFWLSLLLFLWQLVAEGEDLGSIL